LKVGGGSIEGERVFNKVMSRALVKIPRLVPGETSLSPPAALSQREDRGYNSTEHVDKAIRRLASSLPSVARPATRISSEDRHFWLTERDAS